ncbi:uncharacterized protein LOC129595218 isoform X2 [Paramacrobiotus metropolitanus]|uniref:uncharacterized protein LOC129595218 isoform X2 n=1 Tax=Paramacrobiotus metropolitanus TaxID=2943436 RepID=UPI0024459861|nr:uncharacterized protein LOC129595218 isoform X2 [Paramacrobiotus metropolitanus]
MDFDNVTLNDTEYEVYNYTETYNFTAETCEQLLRALGEWNISVEEIITQKADYFKRDTCQRPLLNIALISEHPVKYAYLAIYPILLALCTIGNLLTIAMLRERNVRCNKRSSTDIYLVALAVSDICAVWSQLLDYSSLIDAAVVDPYFKFFLSGAIGGAAFVGEIFINFSDWILISFTVERLLAVVLPLQDGRIVSRKCTLSTVCCLFALAVLAAAYNLPRFYNPQKCKNDGVRYRNILRIVAVCLFNQRQFRALCVQSSATNADVDAGKLLSHPDAVGRGPLLHRYPVAQDRFQPVEFSHRIPALLHSAFGKPARHHDAP